MYQAGVPLRHMRICEPFGPEQRQGLWLYHVIEPDRWAAMCARVSGVKSGGIYAGHDNHFYGHRKILKPEHLDWQEYALLLLNSMPEKTAEPVSYTHLDVYKRQACTGRSLTDKSIYAALPGAIPAGLFIAIKKPPGLTPAAKQLQVNLTSSYAVLVRIR